MRVKAWRKVSLAASSSKLMPSTVSRVFTPALPTDPVAPVVTAAPVAILDTALAATASAISWVAPRLTMDAVTARPIEALAATPVTPPAASVGSKEPTPCAIFMAQTSISPAPSPRVKRPSGVSSTSRRLMASLASGLIPSESDSAPDFARSPAPATKSSTGLSLLAKLARD
ncbi:hypothetical protein D3C73_1120090 [compost metagenome]